MKQTNMWNHLKLDSFEIETPFSKSRTEFIAYFQDNNISVEIPTEMQIIVKSKLLSLDIVFSISFQFSGEKLITVMMSPDAVSEGKALDCRYNKIQKALVNELGHPHIQLRSIMNLLDPDNRLSYWRKDGIRIEHYLMNRFGMEEIIKIEL